MPELEHHFARVNGIRLHYVARGSGPTVLLLHGFPETHRSWDRQIPFLVEHGMRVVAPDLRGYGQSDRPKSGYDGETLARDIACLIDELGVGKVALAGHDWGGALTWEVLTRHAEKITRAVVLDCPHPLAMAREIRKNAKQLRRSWYMLFFQLPILPELWLSARGGRNLARMFRESPGADSAPRSIVEAERDALIGFDALRGPLAYYRTAIKQGLTGARIRRLATHYGPIELPVGIIWGEHDSCLGLELIDPSARFVAQPTVRIVRGAGHFVHQERPDEVNELLLELLDCRR